HINRLPAMLHDLAPDFIFVAGFPQKLPAALLDLPRLGCVNLHPSLLPRYRGPEPFFWQLMNGETQSGLTFHRIDTNFDTGPILVQRAITIEAEDDMNSFFSKFLTLSLDAIPDVLHALVAGIPGTPQPIEGASYAPYVTDAERQLNWMRSATQLRNQVRAWDLIGALAEIEGQRLLLRRARVINAFAPALSAKPGSILEHCAEGILVQAGQGTLLIEDYTHRTQ
ncbi:MAG: methionyl-tRNA formyltransferase, partial [Ktedonobacteraceae bacterium]|nr:methionyl-tRNA formyltransferase [Ktedonobacteraceae bacterium]